MTVELLDVAIKERKQAHLPDLELFKAEFIILVEGLSR